MQINAQLFRVFQLATLFFSPLSGYLNRRERYCVRLVLFIKELLYIVIYGNRFSAFCSRDSQVFHMLSSSYNFFLLLEASCALCRMKNNGGAVCGKKNLRLQHCRTLFHNCNYKVNK